MFKVLGSIPFNHKTKINSIQAIVRVHHWLQMPDKFSSTPNAKVVLSVLLLFNPAMHHAGQLPEDTSVEFCQCDAIGVKVNSACLKEKDSSTQGIVYENDFITRVQLQHSQKSSL